MGKKRKQGFFVRVWQWIKEAAAWVEMLPKRFAYNCLDMVYDLGRWMANGALQAMDSLNFAGLEDDEDE